MWTDSLAYRTASSHVHSYAGEELQWMTHHQQAMECRDCESYLQLGIDAFAWIGRADAEIRKRIFAGEIAHQPSVDESLQALYQQWLKPCEFAFQWAAQQSERGFHVDHLEAFRHCCEEARAILEFHAGEQPVNSAFEQLKTEAMQEHRRGQTAEFF